jgi:hypothetical protein
MTLGPGVNLMQLSFFTADKEATLRMVPNKPFYLGIMNVHKGSIKKVLSSGRLQPYPHTLDKAGKLAKEKYLNTIIRLD